MSSVAAISISPGSPSTSTSSVKTVPRLSSCTAWGSQREGNERQVDLDRLRIALVHPGVDRVQLARRLRPRQQVRGVDAVHHRRSAAGGSDGQGEIGRAIPQVTARTTRTRRRQLRRGRPCGTPGRGAARRTTADREDPWSPSPRHLPSTSRGSPQRSPRPAPGTSPAEAAPGSRPSRRVRRGSRGREPVRRDRRTVGHRPRSLPQSASELCRSSR